MSNTDIILSIQLGGNERSRALHKIFENNDLHSAITKYVLTHRGSEQDAQDVFQETLILFDRQVRLAKFRGNCDWKTYFVSIAKWQWFSVLRKSAPIHAHVEEAVHSRDEAVMDVESGFIDSERREIIDKILEQMGEPCKGVLKLYKLSFSMEEIGQKLGMTPDSVKTRACKCREQFRSFVEKNPHYKNLLNIV
jgi:RNA polymerase sigma factor (sigma-70 family)